MSISVHIGSLGYTVDRVTHADNEALLVGIDATSTSLASLLRSSSVAGTSLETSVRNRMGDIRSRFGILKQRVQSEDYDAFGEYSVGSINSELKRLQDRVRVIQAEVNDTVARRGADRSADAAQASRDIEQRESAQREAETERQRSFLDVYGLYLKLGGGIVGLGLLAYLLGPLIRGLGARAAPRVPTVTAAGLGRLGNVDAFARQLERGLQSQGCGSAVSAATAASEQLGRSITGGISGNELKVMRTRLSRLEDHVVSVCGCQR